MIIYIYIIINEFYKLDQHFIIKLIISNNDNIKMRKI